MVNKIQVTEALLKLKELLEAGMITQQEYENNRKIVLDQH